MKRLLQIPCLWLVLSSATAVATTTTLDVIYSPFDQRAATLDIPTLDSCTRSGTTIDQETCQTPGASLDLGAQRGIVIESISTISGSVGETVYSDRYHHRHMTVNGVKVNVNLVLSTRNGNAVPGTLILSRQQKFTVIPQ